MSYNPPYWPREARSTETVCSHCRSKSETGIHNGCAKCRKVKGSSNGKKPKQ